MSLSPRRRVLPCLFALLAASWLGLHPATSHAATLPGADISPVAAGPLSSALPKGWHQSGAFMEIYVRAYQDSDGDGIGDLRGLISRLDYLQDLGIKGIWLMPINASQDRDHGYAVVDYRNIEADYGTLADFDALLAAAHQRGIGVIMDYVINHSAADHPLFQAANSKQSPFRDWYVWSEQEPEGWQIYGNYPWYSGEEGYYFAGFWSQMPDFNLRNPAVLTWHEDNLRFWLNRGVDGFRFDAVGNLVENGPKRWEVQPENQPIMQRLVRTIQQYPNRYVVCEAPADPDGFGSQDACGSAFAFGLNNKLMTAANGHLRGIADVLRYHNQGKAHMATFTSNHDHFAGRRVFDQVYANEASNRMVAAALLTLPGIPFIYYGEEVGMDEGAGLDGDASLRVPMSWTADASGFSSGQPFRALATNIASHNLASQLGKPDSLHSHYRAMLQLRRDNPALQTGSFEQAEQSAELISFQRKTEQQRLLVLLNFGSDQQAKLAKLPADATLRAVYPKDATALQTDGRGRIKLTMPAKSLRVYQF